MDGAGIEHGDERGLEGPEGRTAVRWRARARPRPIVEPRVVPPPAEDPPRESELAPADAADQVREFAHDLSEGLGTIALFAGALELHLGLDLDPLTARDLDGIRASLERVNSLITATLGAGDDPNRGCGHRAVDTNVVAREARANVEARVVRTGAQIACEPLPWVRGDAIGLTRVFQNLLANAIEYRHPERPPRVRIGARPRPGAWLFEVTDNGRGIDPESAARALDPARPDTGLRSDPNAGLGLGICARIIAAHGGRASAVPRTEGGTVVSFELPRIARPTRPSP